MNLSALIRRDADSVPLRSPLRGQHSIRGPQRYRVSDAAAVLDPEDRETVELFLWQLFADTARQIGGHIHLGPTFIETVAELGADDGILDRLPAYTRKALNKLVEMAKADPVRLPDARLLAHALSIDGATVAFLTAPAKEHCAVLGIDPTADPEAIKAAYREKAKQYHPDRGGDAAAFGEITRAYKALTQGTVS